jgi:hypothetical protein
METPFTLWADDSKGTASTHKQRERERERDAD